MPAPCLVGRRRGALRGRLHRGHVRRGPAARPSLPPDEVRVREDRAHRDARAVARLPAGDRRRPLADRRDGQDRRPVLPLQGAEDGRAAARHGAAARARGWATRTSSRSTSSPARSTTSPTEPGLDGKAFHLVSPEPQSSVESDQHVRRRSPGAPRMTAALPAATLPLALQGPGRARPPAAGARHPRRGGRLRRRSRRASTRAQTTEGARRLGHRGAAAGALRARRCGTTGSATSTPTATRERRAPARA